MLKNFWGVFFVGSYCLLGSIFGKSVFGKPHSYACVVMGENGKILHAVNPTKSIYPASLTKMMLLYLAFEALEKKKLKLTDRLTFSSHAHSQIPCRIDVKPGDTVSVSQGIYGVAIQSANNASVALAERLAGSEAQCARLMTQKARALGLSDTTFYNASGLFHPSQKTTAHDMTRLGFVLRRDFPQHYKYFSTKAFGFRGRTYRNHNGSLGKVNGVDGIKTGFISASGFNVVVSVKLPQKKRLFITVIGAKSSQWREKHVAELVRAAYEAPHTLPVIMTKASGGLKVEGQGLRNQPAVPLVMAKRSVGPQPSEKSNTLDELFGLSED